jgi:hypothetical protein
MSGGHFYPEYCYYQVSQFADGLEEEIQNNGREGTKENDYEWYPNHESQVIEYLKKQVPHMRKMAEIMRHIDYLYAGDHGDDSFMERVKEVEDKYNNPLQQILNDPNDNLNERIAAALQQASAEYDT